MSFQRARRDEQKAERRAGILFRARDLCAEAGVMGWSLNELGRRADITKSNLYRYFGSREEILLILLHEETHRFATRLEAETAGGPMTISQLCGVIAQLYDQQPLLCDLLSVSASVLEQNIALETIRDIKTDGQADSQRVAQAIARVLDGVDAGLAARISFASGIIVAGLWPMASPDAPIRQLAVYDGLQHLDLDFRAELQRMLEAQIAGMACAPGGQS
ncbi:TetR family transcriptional regulator [Ruegeria sp.]|uniref:TetR family transcriptional regulator n=1 Tax=Ruegeria sp. TaxID=1879320 RepID=UPI003B5904CE